MAGDATNLTLPNRTGSATSNSLLAKQRLRAAVLEEHYRINEECPGTHANGGLIAERLQEGVRSVIGAGLYWIDKGFLDPGADGIVSEAGNPAVIEYSARITHLGIDFIEDPTGWQGREIPATIIYIIAGHDVKDITVAGRDAQNVGGEVSGAVSQGGTTQ